MQSSKFEIVNDVIRINDYPFLFLAQLNSAQKQFQHFTGELSLSDAAIQTFRQNIEFNQEYADLRKLPYKHVVFPAKIPVFANVFESIGKPVKPVFSNAHRADNVCYPIDIIEPESDFMRFDTHNSDDGKLKIVNYILGCIGLASLDNVPLYKERSLLGDLGGKVGAEPILVRKIAGFEDLEYTGITYTTQQALTGNMGQIYFAHNISAINKKRLLLFGDSFIQGCIPILSYLFEDVIYLRTPFIQPDIADNLQPDFILTSNAERYLVAVQSAVKKKPYFINYFSSAFKPEKLSPREISAFTALFSGRDSIEYKQWKRKFRIEKCA